MITVGCDQGRHLEVDEKVQADFSASLNDLRTSDCRSNTARQSGFSTFDAEFVPGHEHIGDFVRITSDAHITKNLILIRSNELDEERRRSTDGRGGARYAELSDNPSRRDMRGVLVEGSLVCGDHALSESGIDGFAFVYDYGTGVSSTGRADAK